jgi:putative endopeptidase
MDIGSALHTRPFLRAAARACSVVFAICAGFGGPTALALAAQPVLLTPDKDPLIQDIDSTASPRRDFFRYANGGWLRRHPIPPAERDWGIGRVVVEETLGQLRSICEAAAGSNAPRGSVDQKVGDYWVAAMDTARIEGEGVTPLRPELARIEQIRSKDDCLRAIAFYQTCGVRPLYALYVGRDDKNSEAYVVDLYQGGIGLPDRDYYFLDDSTTARIRGEYPRHVAAMFRFLGYDDPGARRAAEDVFGIERNLAQASRRIEQLRDPYANYNKISLDELNRRTPAIDWREQLRIAGVPKVDSVVVGQPEFLARVDSMLTSVPLDQWKEYLRWCLLNTFAERLPDAIEAENFHFYGTLLDGRKEQRPRWKRALDAEENSIGELMGQVWVRRHCSPEVKARYDRLVEDVLTAYAERIRGLDWMSDATKEKALAKLSRVGRKVAYPDRWRDFSTLEIGRDSYLENQMKANQWWFHHQADKIGHPVDRTEWDMTPQTYNAYYDDSNVEIVLPAAVFRFPDLPDSVLDDAILYAGVGAATIGHEITHGFDDEGRLYDERGNLRPWWTPEDSVKFTARAKVLAEQFDQYIVGGRHVRGEASLGENLADLGGLAIGYQAFRKTDQWKKGEKLNGLTPDQRFFLAYAYSWMGQFRPEYLDYLIMSDVHAPNALRVNGPLANMPEFYAAFGVRPGDAMYRPDSLRVSIW